MSAIILILFFVIFILYKKLNQIESNYQHQKQHLNYVAADANVICSGVVGLNDRLTTIEQRLRQVNERQDRYEMSDQSEKSYTQPIRMVHNGATVQDLMKNCDLTESEAQLIVMLHGKK
ncbi:MAG: DUF2802 domain-containing protein [Methylococcales bacterium]|jgi:predicted GTPase|nr:DUF2802 domain-containing protein [Methylococcales bacterium]